MIRLTLKPNALLEYLSGPNKKTEEAIALDVSSRAIEFLLCPMQIDDGVYLGDIFSLLKANPVLLQVFKSTYAPELMEEAFSTKPMPYSSTYSADGMEYLELYQTWYRDSSKKEYTTQRPLDLHGIGFTLLADVIVDGNVHHEKGARIPWSIAFLSPLALFNHPIQINKKITIIETDPDSGMEGEVLEEINHSSFTLGQVLEGILRELSFYGPKEVRDARAAQLSNPET